MKVSIISLGKIKQAFVKDGEAEYLKRLKPYLKVEVSDLNNDKFSALSAPEIKKREAELLRKNFEKGTLLVLLDEGGKQHDSKQFSKLLAERMDRGQSISFAIGGAFGWDEAIKKEADLVISLSALTFTYQMTRLILVEQLYRAITLIKRIPYHK